MVWCEQWKFPMCSGACWASTVSCSRSRRRPPPSTKSSAPSRSITQRAAACGTHPHWLAAIHILLLTWCVCVCVCVCVCMSVQYVGCRGGESDRVGGVDYGTGRTAALSARIRYTLSQHFGLSVVVLLTAVICCLSLLLCVCVCLCLCVLQASPRTTPGIRATVSSRRTRRPSARAHTSHRPTTWPSAKRLACGVCCCCSCMLMCVCVCLSVCLASRR